MSEQEHRAGLPVNDWKGKSQSNLKGRFVFNFQLKTEEPHIEVSEPVLMVKY